MHGSQTGHAKNACIFKKKWIADRKIMYMCRLQTHAAPAIENHRIRGGHHDPRRTEPRTSHAQCHLAVRGDCLWRHRGNACFFGDVHHRLKAEQGACSRPLQHVTSTTVYPQGLAMTRDQLIKELRMHSATWQSVAIVYGTIVAAMILSGLAITG